MVLSLDRFVGKVAVVTGASSGIGAAIAEALVNEGIIVAGLARRVDRIEALARKLSGKKGKLHPIKADITKEEELLKALKWTRETLGPIHILVNNAGIELKTSLTEGTTEEWRTIFDLNVLALSIATREVVQQMKEKNIDGHIIHINSVGGHKVIDVPGMGPYSGSKFTVTALTETLRQEFNHLKLKIKITSVSPGATESEMHADNPEMRKFILENNVPFLKTEDVADGVVYVLSTPPHVQVHELIVKPIGEFF